MQEFKCNWPKCICDIDPILESPICDVKMAENYLKEHGYDPKEIGRKGKEFVDQLILSIKTKEQ